MIHLYYGDGKGKTTAACGLALRAAGSGMRVLFLQFFKDGSSSEIAVLSAVENVTVKIPDVYYGRYKNMTEAERTAVAECYDKVLNEIAGRAFAYDLIVFDEAVSADAHGFFTHGRLLDLLKTEGARREIVLTGRSPAPELLELADYATEMKKVKHPFDRGIPARRGIEY
ncbi:MAG: cob(I)yrinic acid a,c-diamide adenosyltransferase [Clostridia bacterium]|nr:cob(I)yrinic acid a,c-diamide adenosyltransferase [Clostridia bacterium]